MVNIVGSESDMGIVWAGVLWSPSAVIELVSNMVDEQTRVL